MYQLLRKKIISRWLPKIFLDDTSLLKHFFNTDLSNIIILFSILFSNENKCEEREMYKIQPNEMKKKI